MQEAANKKIDLQTQQVKPDPLDSLLCNQTAQPLSSADTPQSSSSKKIDNRFQASLERQRNLLLNMEQQLVVYPPLSLNSLPAGVADEPDDDDKAMDIQVDSNNNSLPLLFACQRPGILPGIGELRGLRTRGFAQFANDENEFSHFVEDDFSRLSQNASLYDSYELGQSIKMEDAFRDDDLDFKSGPTLAELNLHDDDMIDNLPTVNPNSILCPSTPLQPNKNGFLMGINYMPSIGANAGLSDGHSKGLVASKYPAEDDHFSLANSQFENGSGYNPTLNSHSNSQRNLNSSTNSGGSTIKQEFDAFSTNGNQSTNGRPNKQSIGSRARGRNKSQGDKQPARRTAKGKDAGDPNKTTGKQQSLSANNQVLCKLLNEKNESLNNLNSIYLINSGTDLGTLTGAPSSMQPSTSSAGNLISAPFQTISVSSLATTQLSPNLANKSISQPTSLSPNDLLLNQLHSLSTQAKCGLAGNLRLNNSSANRNRNSSISTEHSFSSSHDEGFISQAEDDSDEKDLDDSMICDPKLVAGSKQAANKAKRKRARKELDKDRNSNLISPNLLDSPATINRNLKKIKLEDASGPSFKPSTSAASGSFTSTLSTVKEERTGAPIKKDEKVGSKGRVNYKITKEKPILNDIQQQNQLKFDAGKFELSKPLLNDDKIDEESSDDDDESFYGDYEAGDLIGATTSDDQQNKWSLNMGRSRKNSAQRYFWQYNVQAKGPKGEGRFCSRVLKYSEKLWNRNPNAFHFQVPNCRPSTMFSMENWLHPVRHSAPIWNRWIRCSRRTIARSKESNTLARPDEATVTT